MVCTRLLVGEVGFGMKKSQAWDGGGLFQEPERGDSSLRGQSGRRERGDSEREDAGKEHAKGRSVGSSPPGPSGPPLLALKRSLHVRSWR